jgi:hypothetical protein
MTKVRNRNQECYGPTFGHRFREWDSIPSHGQGPYDQVGKPARGSARKGRQPRSCNRSLERVSTNNNIFIPFRRSQDRNLRTRPVSLVWEDKAEPGLHPPPPLTTLKQDHSRCCSHPPRCLTTEVVASLVSTSCTVIHKLRLLLVFLELTKSLGLFLGGRDLDLLLGGDFP